MLLKIGLVIFLLVDVHCHVDLYPDLEDVVTRAKRFGVRGIVAVSMDIKSMEEILKIQNQYPNYIFASLGLHPEVCGKISEKDLIKALDLIKNNSEKLVAVGEIGLDHYFVKNKEFYPWQEKIFREMLGFSQKLGLPIILHTKGAEKVVFKILEEYDFKAVLIHWYTGPRDLIDIGIKRGYYFSITPAIAYSKKVQYLAERVSLEYLLTESDGPVEYNKIRGEPKDCLAIVKKIAEIKGHGEDRVKNKLFENAISLFNLKTQIS